MQTYLVVAIISYLLGSIPFGYILVRIFRKQDVRTIGSGNIGATNVARSGAKGLGIATLILDAAKGYAAVYLAERYFLNKVMFEPRGGIDQLLTVAIVVRRRWSRKLFGSPNALFFHRRKNPRFDGCVDR